MKMPTHKVTPLMLVTLGQVAACPFSMQIITLIREYVNAKSCVKFIETRLFTLSIFHV